MKISTSSISIKVDFCYNLAPIFNGANSEKIVWDLFYFLYNISYFFKPRKILHTQRNQVFNVYY